MRYLTPTLLQLAGTGLPYEGMTASALASLILRAEQDIDLYMAFGENTLGFSPGIREQRDPWKGRSRRIYPRSLPVPVKSVLQFNIVVSQRFDGSPVQASVPPTLELVVNDLGYVETVAVAIIWGLVPVVAAVTNIEPYIHFQYDAGYQIVKSGSLLTQRDGSASYDALIPFWDVTTPPVVYGNGQVLDPLTYSVDATNGAIVFAVRPSTRLTITADFVHTIPEAVTQAAIAAITERAEQKILREQGVIGVMSVKSGVRSITRTRKGDEQEDWRDLLSGLKMGTVVGA